MIIRKTLNTNYQRLSTNRYVIDSPRFWRKEYNPRFKDIFTLDDFRQVFEQANNTLSFKLMNTQIYYESLYAWFYDLRFSHIPKKDPMSKDAFLSELFFTLVDILPNISYKQYELKNDDFNLVTHKAETGKQDTTNITVNELSEQNSKLATDKDILSASENKTMFNSNIENIDEVTNQNTKSVSDVFLSPQNQGVAPVRNNIKYDGVDGLTLSNGGGFTTNTNNQLVGDSIKTGSNSSATGNQSENNLRQSNDVRLSDEISSKGNMSNSSDITNVKNDDYAETLDFNRGARLQDWYNLSKDRLWMEIITRLSKWVLRIDIATSDNNYLGCEYYE